MPVFQLDVPYPTNDKPQSKLFYQNESWWAVLPRSSGPSLWQRKNTGWVEHHNVAAALVGIPGRCDVWADSETIMAVAVDKERLHIFKLHTVTEDSSLQWNATSLVALKMPEGGKGFETATIVRDGSGRWWVTAPNGGRVWVWSSGDGVDWTDPYLLAEGIADDDICLIAQLPEGVGVIWSDQITDAVKMRIHKNHDAPNLWMSETIIEQGNHTADDHLNTALSPDGTLWVATKNSLDRVGQPQLVLRVRSKDGIWRNYPYAIRGETAQPSRPIVVATDDPAAVFTGFTIYHSGKGKVGRVAFGKVDTTSEAIVDVTSAILPTMTHNSTASRINDVTGPKMPFRKGIPWIVLASDGAGNVYEMDLNKSF